MWRCAPLVLLVALAGCTEGNKPEEGRLRRPGILPAQKTTHSQGGTSSMKRMMPLLLLALTAPASADEKEAEVRAKAVLDTAARVVEVMRSIKDKASAEKAKPELEKAFAAMKKAREELRGLSEEEKEKLKKSFGPKFEALQGDFVREGQRLQKTMGVMEVLIDSAPFRQAREEKTQIAKVMLHNLDKAIQTYKLTTGSNPRALQELTASPGGGVPPFLRKDAIKDPWGRMFQYNPAGPKNKGEKPDVWSLGPPDQKDALIGNWELKR